MFSFRLTCLNPPEKNLKSCGCLVGCVWHRSHDMSIVCFNFKTVLHSFIILNRLSFTALWAAWANPTDTGRVGRVHPRQVTSLSQGWHTHTMTLTHIHIYRQIRVIEACALTAGEGRRVPGENQSRHEEKMQTRHSKALPQPGPGQRLRNKLCPC